MPCHWFNRYFQKFLRMPGRLETKALWWPLLCVSGGMGMPYAAFAQDSVGGDPPDAAGTRPQPAYDALGIRAGSFLLYPTLTIAGAYDSNVFARSIGRQSDESVTVTPALTLQRRYPGEEFTLDIDARFRRYASLTSQNDDQYRASAAGRLQISNDTIVGLEAGWARATASRGTYENALQFGEPLQKDDLTGGLNLQHRFNRLTARLGGSAEKFDFRDVRFADGSVVDQSYRNGRRLGGSVGLAYQLGARFSAQIQGSINDYHYNDTDPLTSRDATAYSITAGGRYELSRLLFFEFGAGVRKHNFKNPLFEDLSGLALNGSLRWYPTPLLSVRFDLSQTTSTSSSALVSAVEVTSAKLDADYEIKRNLLLSTGVEVSREDFGGVHGKSTFVAFNARLNWKLNRWLRLTPSANYQTRRGSTSASSSYDAFRLALAVTLAR